jgi:BlaI family penicillinase repressor
MSELDISLTPAEWNLMECLWEKAPRTGREAAEYLKEHVGWTRSTTLTLLRRMTEKGIVSCSDMGGVNAYSPLLRREDAVLRETDNILKRVYKGSVRMMMSAVTKKQDLTREEIDALYEILRQAEEAKK